NVQNVNANEVDIIALTHKFSKMKPSSFQGGLEPLKAEAWVLETEKLFEMFPYQVVSVSSIRAQNAYVLIDSGLHILIFDKIIAKEIPYDVVYKDGKVLAFRNINPKAHVHVLVIPKHKDGLTQLGNAEARQRDILGKLLYAAKIVAEKEGILEGFRVVINNGPTAFTRRNQIYPLLLSISIYKNTFWGLG
ncbi:Adenylylsulfatase HINT1, partial [Camellia lanceoleosa]